MGILKEPVQRSEWYTPAYLVAAVEEVLGRIDLDPASCEEAQRTIAARVYFNKEQNGLKFQWRGRVFLNPPYAKKQAGMFVRKLIDDWEAGHIDQAVLLINNGTETAWFQKLWPYSICFVSGRICFESPIRKSYSPAVGSVFVYFGRNTKKFGEVFSRFGPVFERVGDGLRKLRPMVKPERK